MVLGIVFFFLIPGIGKAANLVAGTESLTNTVAVSYTTGNTREQQIRFVPTSNFYMDGLKLRLWWASGGGAPTDDLAISLCTVPVPTAVPCSVPLMKWIRTSASLTSSSVLYTLSTTATISLAGGQTYSIYLRRNTGSPGSTRYQLGTAEAPVFLTGLFSASAYGKSQTNVWSTTPDSTPSFSLVEGPPPTTQVSLNSAIAVQYAGGQQTILSEGNWSGLAPTYLYFSGVRLDGYASHAVWPLTGPFAVTGSATSSSSGFVDVPNGLWRVRLVAVNTNGTVTVSNYIDVSTTNAIFSQLTVGAIPLNQYQIGQDGYVIPDTSAPAGFNLSASGVSEIGKFLRINNDGCASVIDESASSTLCATGNWFGQLLNYPLISWPLGITNAVRNAWVSASSTSSAYSLSLDGHNAGMGWIPTMTIVDSASTGAGIGAYFNKTGSNINYYRPIMSGLVFVVWVIALQRKAQELTADRQVKV